MLAEIFESKVGEKAFFFFLNVTKLLKESTRFVLEKKLVKRGNLLARVETLSRIEKKRQRYF